MKKRIKDRGSKYNGRGHAKHKRGSRGGSGRSGFGKKLKGKYRPKEFEKKVHYISLKALIELFNTNINLFIVNTDEKKILIISLKILKKEKIIGYSEFLETSFISFLKKHDIHLIKVKGVKLSKRIGDIIINYNERK